MDGPTNPDATDLAKPSVPGAATGPTLRATCWGTRGSIPSPGPATARFGGNTSCLEIRTDDERCHIFDAGTGIRVLGNRLGQEQGPTAADIFVTHFHWDHIQGIPFFAPLHAEDSRIRIHAARQGDLDIETLLKTQMGPVYFPVPYEALAAELSFEHLSGRPWHHDGTEVAAYRVRHAAHTYGYRIRAGSAAVAYIPDNELVGSSYPVDGPDWYDGLVAFLDGVDVLFHDAMFTEEEYPDVEGWGHSTFEQAVKLAEDAGVARLYFFHHAPERTDAELLGILDTMREAVDRRGSDLALGVAAEGEELLVTGGES
ncbi:MAG: MBL fold metallo-hydrolase [Longimicrobiales bacterium]|nr:MBL fold metallo-hydrolase [Longimicrobiales bacterium]